MVTLFGLPFPPEGFRVQRGKGFKLNFFFFLTTTAKSVLNKCTSQQTKSRGPCRHSRAGVPAQTTNKKPLTTDVLALATMKNAAKCDM